MKKLFAFIFTLCLSFVLVGCEFINGETITVKFETNGGSEIADKKVNINNVTNFTLPQDPTKDGYNFGGWFIDENFTNSFESIDITKTEFTLYAKWNEILPDVKDSEEIYKVVANLNFVFKLEMDPYTPVNDEEGTDEVVENDGEELDDNEFDYDLDDSYTVSTNLNYEGSLGVVLNVNKKEITKLEDLEASIIATIKVQDKTQKEEENPLDSIYSGLLNAPIVISAYVKDGNLYASYGLVTYKINLVEVIDEVNKLIEAQKEEIKDENINFTEEELTLENIQKLVEDFAKENNIDLTVLTGLIEKIYSVMPKAEVSEDGTVTYKLTQEMLENAVDSVVNYFKENIEAILTEISKIEDAIGSDDELEDEEGQVETSENDNEEPNDDLTGDDLTEEEIDPKEYYTRLATKISELVKSVVKVYELEVTYNKETGKYTVKVDVELDGTDLQELIYMTIKSKLQVNLEINVSTLEGSIQFPSFDNAVDMTESVITSIKAYFDDDISFDIDNSLETIE